MRITKHMFFCDICGEEIIGGNGNENTGMPPRFDNKLITTHEMVVNGKKLLGRPVSDEIGIHFNINGIGKDSKGNGIHDLCQHCIEAAVLAWSNQIITRDMDAEMARRDTEKEEEEEEE